MNNQKVVPFKPKDPDDIIYSYGNTDDFSISGVLNESNLKNYMKSRLIAGENCDFKDDTLNKIWNNLLIIESGNIPDAFPDELCGYTYKMSSQLMISIQMYYQGKFGYTLIDKRFCNAMFQLINNHKCLEIMCGSALLSKSLIKMGADIIITDDHSWGWTEGIKIDAVDAVKEYGKDVDFIILSFPPIDSEIATKALCTMRKVNPKCKMIYIGELRGGCCASDSFFEIADRIDCDMITQINQVYPHWYSMYSSIQLLK